MDETPSIARLKAGDIRGLEDLVRLYQVRALRAAFLVTHERALAEDVVQAAFLRAYERIDQFDARRPFGPWFLRGVVNDALKAAVRRERDVSVDASSGDDADDDLALAERLAAEGPGPEETLLRTEDRRLVRGYLRALSPAQRAAVVLRYYLDLSVAETAERLNRSPGTIKGHLHAARERLRQLLAPSRAEDARDADGDPVRGRAAGATLPYLNARQEDSP